MLYLLHMQQHIGWSFCISAIHSPLDKRRPYLHMDDFNTFNWSHFHEIKILLQVNWTTCQDSTGDIFFHPCAAKLAIQFISSRLSSKFAFIKIFTGEFRYKMFVPNKHFVRCAKMSQKCEFSLFANIAFKLCTFSNKVLGLNWVCNIELLKGTFNLGKFLQIFLNWWDSWY